MKTVTITDTSGQQASFTILYLPRQDAWRVLGCGLDVFVPFDSVRFPTAYNVVNRAHELDESAVTA